MNEVRSAAAIAILSLCAMLTVGVEARGVELTGAWATSASECKKVFVRKGRANQVTFAPLSELHGGGFIVESGQMVGRTARCKIKARKDDGETVHIIAACASDVMLSNVQFELKAVDQDKILRLFPGMPDMEIGYYRCPI
jgi:hypothetical protein